MIEELRRRNHQEDRRTFKLSTLIQKRLVQLNAGARPLVDPKNDNKMQISLTRSCRQDLPRCRGECPSAAAPQAGSLDVDFRDL